MSSLITLSDPRSPAAEAFQSLRTNIEFSRLETTLRSILVTCADAETDKSSALANLAVVMAQAGDRVVVVDGDLRRPRQHEIFGAANSRGLTDWLKESGTPALVETGVANLRLLPSGPLPPNPVALLSGNRLAELLTQLSAETDYILVDAPPVLAVTDAALWAGKGAAGNPRGAHQPGTRPARQDCAGKGACAHCGRGIVRRRGRSGRRRTLRRLTPVNSEQ
jgi:capsular exopolysaccharide synthesis family protein